jgi:anti-sigma28 factor (negative regulator of flagellin synthesis)
MVSQRSAAPPPSAENARAARIEQLKSDVQSGSYKPDAEKVAVAVLKELA